MKIEEIDEMVKDYVDSMPDMVVNSNGIMNWRVFFNEVAKKVAGTAYRQGLNDMQKQMMKDAVEAEYWDGSLFKNELREKFKDGNKVKIIIIKED